MTINELTELAQDARDDLGGDAQIRIARQPGYPIRSGTRSSMWPQGPAELLFPGESQPCWRYAAPPAVSAPAQARIRRVMRGASSVSHYCGPASRQLVSSPVSGELTNSSP
jgi:hypothetical protein